MQEEVENRTVNLVISTTRLTARALISGYRKFEEHRKQRAAARSAKKSQKPTGKQTVKQLADAMTATFNAYSAEVLKRQKAPSVLKQLAKLKAYVKALPVKTRTKEKERNLNR